MGEFRWSVGGVVELEGRVGDLVGLAACPARPHSWMDAFVGLVACPTRPAGWTRSWILWRVPPARPAGWTRCVLWRELPDRRVGRSCGTAGPTRRRVWSAGTSRSAHTARPPAHPPAPPGRPVHAWSVPVSADEPSVTQAQAGRRSVLSGKWAVGRSGGRLDARRSVRDRNMAGRANWRRRTWTAPPTIIADVHERAYISSVCIIRTAAKCILGETIVATAAMLTRSCSLYPPEGTASHLRLFHSECF